MIADLEIHIKIMAAKKFKVTTENFSFGSWNISAKTGPILTSSEDERISGELDIPALPEMCFGETSLQINHNNGFGLSFNAIDALRLIDNKHDKIKVAYAAEWQGQRELIGVSKEIVKPFDWTYTTDYKGTLTGDNHLKEVETTEKIDIEKLKKQEKIYFYQDMVLFEDELGDNGIAKMNVKMRVMPSSFFILLRFYLRVDDVLVRINDTRVYHECGTNYILREFSSKEKKVSEMMNPNSENVADELDFVTQSCTKLEFDESQDGKV